MAQHPLWWGGWKQYSWDFRLVGRNPVLTNMCLVNYKLEFSLKQEIYPGITPLPPRPDGRTYDRKQPGAACVLLLATCVLSEPAAIYNINYDRWKRRWSGEALSLLIHIKLSVAYTVLQQRHWLIFPACSLVNAVGDWRKGAKPVSYFLLSQSASLLLFCTSPKILSHSVSCGVHYPWCSTPAVASRKGGPLWGRNL